jgi:hypothetical protein
MSIQAIYMPSHNLLCFSSHLAWDVPHRDLSTVVPRYQLLTYVQLRVCRDERRRDTSYKRDKRSNKRGKREAREAQEAILTILCNVNSSHGSPCFCINELTLRVCSCVKQEESRSAHERVRKREESRGARGNQCHHHAPRAAHINIHKHTHYELIKHTRYQCHHYALEVVKYHHHAARSAHRDELCVTWRCVRCV